MSDACQLNKCDVCERLFTTKSNLNKHYRQVHGLDPEGNIKCPLCNAGVAGYSRLRIHIAQIHSINIEKKEQYFENMDKFQAWKQTIETTEKVSYTAKATKRMANGDKKTYFTCHRSGYYSSKSTGKRAIKSQGSCKIESHCPSTIEVIENAKGVFVAYFKQHICHFKYPNLSEAGKDAVAKNISNGVPFENVLDDIQDYTDGIECQLIKSRHLKIITKAWKNEEYTPAGMSDEEGVNRWIRNCSEMDVSPVLRYTQQGDDILLVIMTEFQKSILMSSDKHIICIDSSNRKRGLRFYLTTLMVLDDCDMAYTVAFCISSTIDKGVIVDFMRSLRAACGPLSCNYFMSDRESFYFEAWQEVMQDNSKWLWSKWITENLFRHHLWKTKLPIPKRSDLFRRMKLIIECKNKNVCETMFKDFYDLLAADPDTEKTAHFLAQTYAGHKEFWVYCYYKDLDLKTIIQFQGLNRTMVICGREGRKSRLDKFIFVLMKFMRFKMLDRLTGVLDEEKISMVVDVINAHHESGLEIPTDSISSIGDKFWLISSDDEEGDVHVVRDYDSCPDFCSLKCSECDICVHMFSCSCMRNSIYADLCPHIHAVVWKFLTPFRFSPLPSPARNDDYEPMVDDNDDNTELDRPADRFDRVLKMTHDVFKKMRSNKSELSNQTLEVIEGKLSELMDICSGKVKELNLNMKDSSEQTELKPDTKDSFAQTDITTKPVGGSFVPTNPAIRASIPRIENIFTMKPNGRPIGNVLTRNPDGTFTSTSPDDRAYPAHSIETATQNHSIEPFLNHPIGTVFTKNPDGTFTPTNPNKTAYPANAVKAGIPRQPIGTVAIRNPDGTFTLTNSNETAYPANAVEKSNPRQPIETFCIRNPDGTFTLTNSNETAYTANAIETGNPRHPIGTVAIRNPDGTFTLTNPNENVFPENPIIKLLDRFGSRNIIETFRSRNPTGAVTPRKTIPTFRPRNPTGTVTPRKTIITVTPKTSTGVVTPRNPTGTVTPRNPTEIVAPRNPIRTNAPKKPIGTDASNRPIGTDALNNPIGTDTSRNPIETDTSRNPIGTDPPRNPIGADAPRNPIPTDAPSNLIGTDSPNNPIGAVQVQEKRKSPRKKSKKVQETNPKKS